MPPDFQRKHANDFHIRVLACNSPDLYMENFPPFLKTSTISMDNYGLSSGVTGIKSQLLGNQKAGQDVGIIAFDIRKVTAVRIYHGYALDGMRFYIQKEPEPSKEKAPSIPPRDYLGKLTHSFKSSVSSMTSSSTTSVLFGKETPNYTDAVLEPNELITGFNIRCGQWIDAVQIITSHGRVTDMFGNKTGGSLAELIPPTGQYILGVYGRVGRWVDGIGIIYGG